MTLKQRITALLAQGFLRPAEIAKALSAPASSVRRELLFLKRSGSVATDNGRYAIAPVSEKPDIKLTGLTESIAMLLWGRIEPTISDFVDMAHGDNYGSAFLDFYTAMQPSEIARALEATASSVRARLAEMMSAGLLQHGPHGYYANKLTPEQKSATFARNGQFAVRVYRDAAGREVIISAPYGQYRRKLKSSGGYNNKIWLTGVPAKLPGSQLAFGVQSGEPLPIVAYPVERFRVIDIDSKRLPGITDANNRKAVLRAAKSSGATHYEETRNGGLHLIFPAGSVPGDELEELQDPDFERISKDRGYYGTRTYKIKPLT